jgi:hypothetical protein
MPRVTITLRFRLPNVVSTGNVLVQEWLDGMRPNNGVGIYTAVAEQLSISSRENSSNNPQLIVTY